MRVGHRDIIAALRPFPAPQPRCSAERRHPRSRPFSTMAASPAESDAPEMPESPSTSRGRTAIARCRPCPTAARRSEIGLPSICKVRRDLGQRHQDEGPLQHARMRHLQPGLADRSGRRTPVCRCRSGAAPSAPCARASAAARLPGRGRETRAARGRSELRPPRSGNPAGRACPRAACGKARRPQRHRVSGSASSMRSAAPIAFAGSPRLPPRLRIDPLFIRGQTTVTST